MRLYSHFPSYFLLFIILFAFLICVNSDATSSPEGSDNEPEHPPKHHDTNLAILIAAFTTVFVGGLGDKTFLIAAFMSMKFRAILIFIGAAGALFIILGASAAFGSFVTNLIPDSVLHIGTTVLFFFFGLKILYEAYTFQDKQMIEEQEQVQKQLELVESKIHHSSVHHHNHLDKSPLLPVELQNIEALEKESPSLSRGQVSLVANNNESENKYSEENTEGTTKAVLFEAFSLIFFAEWGDRSQINTIALASQYNPFIVFIGGFFGHLACIAIAIVGGRYVAERLSEKTILYAAGVSYIVLGVYSIFD